MKTKTYVTFGQNHYHIIGYDIFDKDCVGVIEHSLEEDGSELAYKTFGDKYCFVYPAERWDQRDLAFYPRGYLEVKR